MPNYLFIWIFSEITPNEWIIAHSLAKTGPVSKQMNYRIDSALISCFRPLKNLFNIDGASYS